jgi:hypothetical protein
VNGLSSQWSLLSSEFSLAAACAMWPPSARRVEAIRIAASRPLDWAQFVRVARRHRVLGLVHDGLKRAAVDMPPPIASEIAARAKALLHENLIMASEALRLQRLFDEKGISAVSFKGASLAMLAYGNLGLRQSKDIDLLVPLETMKCSTALIEHAGYRRFDPPAETSEAQLKVLTPRRKDFGFVHDRTGIEIELHWRLFLNPHAMDEASVAAASQVVQINETARLRTLGRDDLFTYLCVHGAIHWWNQLKWLADVGALLAAEPEGGVERLYRAAEVRGAGRAAAQAMMLCHRLLGIPLSLSITRLGSSRKARWLQQTAIKAMTIGGAERDPHEQRFGTTQGSLAAFLLGESWPYRWAELRHLLTNEADVLSVPLPERLRFLYPIMRVPLWAWRQATRSKAKRSVPKAQISAH